MSKYIIYIELYSSIKEDYDELDIVMRKNGFYENLANHKDTDLKYDTSYCYDSDSINEKADMINKVKKIIKNINKLHRTINVTKDGSIPLESTSISMF